MKNKQIKYTIGVIMTLFILMSCTDDAKLETESAGVVTEDSFYKTEQEAYAGLIAVYDKLGKFSGGIGNNILIGLNAASDDFVCGGGDSGDQAGLQAISNYTISPGSIPVTFYNTGFQGIFRANVLLLKLPNVPMDEAKKARFAAEAKALRALYYFDLVRMFKNIPLLTAPVAVKDIKSVKQADPKAVYAQIEKDLMEAITDLPVTLTNSELGRMSKGAAQALLGKVYLYDNKSVLAAQQLADVNGTPGGTSMYGYKLQANFADLWSNKNEFNSESIFEINYTEKSNADWGNFEGPGNDEGNVGSQLMGIRGYKRTASSTAPDYINGWGFNPLTEDAIAVMRPDPRFAASVVDAEALAVAGQITYDKSYQDKGCHLAKYMPLNSDIQPVNPFLNFNKNVYLIRLADTYLLEAEALGGAGARAQALLDAVRARVGLPSVPVSIDAIMNERRLELLGEGHRWFDLVRTNKAAGALASRGFKVGKNEVLPIPIAELFNTSIIQNPGY
jgi:starch-binding outer membrane protein, SusD/RagB family